MKFLKILCIGYLFIFLSILNSNASTSEILQQTGDF